ncbi:hypothetical protein FHG87_006400 [Trinorchestia longiramus]|nr:hypothetical protein FHG87_006400 [Trinorchestia longiramus]
MSGQAQAAVPSQPPYTYNEATTLGVTGSLPSTSKVNISTNNSHHLNNSTYSQQQSRGIRNQPSFLYQDSLCIPEDSGHNPSS